MSVQWNGGGEGIGAVALADLLDRVIDRGVVLSGDLVISLAGIDLVYCNLRVLLASVGSLEDGAS